jgi:hypothetical protein
MAVKMSAEKSSPVHWEHLRTLDPPALAKEFEQMAQKDLGWAIDQAKCLAYNVFDNKPQMSVIESFSRKASRQALENGTAEQALLALQISCESGDTAPVNEITSLLKEMARKDTERAMEMAAYLKASYLGPGPLCEKLSEFMVSNTYICGTHKTVLNLVRGLERSPLNDKDLGKLCARALFLSEDESYESYCLLSEMLGASELGTEQRSALAARHKELSENPSVLKAILEIEHGTKLEVVMPQPQSPRKLH